MRSGDDDELIAWDLERDVFQIVDAGAMNGDGGTALRACRLLLADRLGHGQSSPS
jgi:hypothetical protein